MSQISDIFFLSDINLLQKKNNIPLTEKKNNSNSFEEMSFHLKVKVTEYNFLRRELCILKCLLQA